MLTDAKGEILNNIKKNGTIILNRDDKYFDYLKKKAMEMTSKYHFRGNVAHTNDGR